MRVLFILLALVGWISTQSAETLELRELLTELKKELADEEKIEAKSGKKQMWSILLCTAKRQYLLTCKVSRYCLLALNGSIQ